MQSATVEFGVDCSESHGEVLQKSVYYRLLASQTGRINIVNEV